jgi:hypothetical protein
MQIKQYLGQQWRIITECAHSHVMIILILVVNVHNRAEKHSRKQVLITKVPLLPLQFSFAMYLQHFEMIPSHEMTGKY